MGVHWRVLAVAIAAAGATALNNGVGLLPEMGANMWYMLHKNLVNYVWIPGY